MSNLIFSFLQFGSWGVQSCLRDYKLKKKNITSAEMKVVMSKIPELKKEEDFWKALQLAIDTEKKLIKKVMDILGKDFESKVRARRLLSYHAQANSFAVHINIPLLPSYQRLKLIYHPKCDSFTHQWVLRPESQLLIICLRIVDTKIGHVMGGIIGKDNRLQLIDVNGKLGEDFYTIHKIKISSNRLSDQINTIFPDFKIVLPQPHRINQIVHQTGQCAPLTLLWLELFVLLKCKKWDDIIPQLKKYFTFAEYQQIKKRYLAFISHQILQTSKIH